MNKTIAHPGRRLLHPALLADMAAKNIDIDKSLEVLDAINDGSLGAAKKASALSVPALDGKRIVDAQGLQEFRLRYDKARSRLAELGEELPASARIDGDELVIDRPGLLELGERLLGQAAWGVLNGGSATSYADRKKNQAMGPGVFDAIRGGFELLAPLCEGRPKGLTPAYINPDGSPGISFLMLKMRAALRLSERVVKRLGSSVRRPVLPFFQMTSPATDAVLADEYASWQGHPLLNGLASSQCADPRKPLSAVQPLMAAYTHSADASPRRVFDSAWGKKHCSIALPGGHGQSFWVLADVYRSLLAQGYRFAWIGNVDNSGYLPDPLALAVFALSGAEAAYELAYRTPVDIKGGILVEDHSGRLTIAELGQAMSLDTALDYERKGARILFNCATGLFDLAALVPRLESIARNLPLRVSDQDKDAGRYSQAEQNTWESMGLFDKVLCLAVGKSERFLAAKLLAETILGSGLNAGQGLPPEVEAAASTLSDGMNAFLSGPCGLVLKEGRWQVPV